MNIVIRPERNADKEAIWNVNRAVFETDAEAELVGALREGGVVEVSLVSEADGQIVGHVLFSRLSIISEAGAVNAVSLAPMAVLPSHQRRGIGSKLVEAGLQACRDEGHRVVVVLGHPEFYRRFGFSSELARPLESPFGGGDAYPHQQMQRPRWPALAKFPRRFSDQYPYHSLHLFGDHGRTVILPSVGQCGFSITPDACDTGEDIVERPGRSWRF